MGFARLLVIVGGAIAFVAVKEAVENAEKEARERAWAERRLSDSEFGALVVLAIAAVVAAVLLGAIVGGQCAFLPLIAWVAVLLLLRTNAKERGRQRAALEDARRRQQQKAEREAATRRAVNREKRVKELGKEGADLLKNAESATQRIARTEAARTGWLGDPTELDFRADLMMITAYARTATQLRGLIDEHRALPNLSVEDRDMVEDARRKSKRLMDQARERTKLLEKCAEKASLIDQSLRDEREESRIAERRDEVRSRMSAALYGVDATPPKPPSEATDKVEALASAYCEIKHVIDNQRCAAETNSDNAERPVSTTPNETDSVITQAWKWLTS